MKLLLATDGSEGADGAARFVAALPLPEGSEVHVLSVVMSALPPPGMVAEPAFVGVEAVQQLHEVEAHYASDLVHQAAAALAGEIQPRMPGVKLTSEVRTGGAAHEILAVAEGMDADLIVLGPEGHSGLEGFLLGSTARNVAKHAARPVLIARPPRNGLRQVLLAVDGSEHARHATEFLAGFPLPAEAEVMVAHAVRPHRPVPAAYSADPQGYLDAVESVRQNRRAGAAALVEAARDRLTAAGRNAFWSLPEGDPTRELLRLAEERRADLLVAGARGVSPIQALLVGSVTDRLLKSAPCSILIVH